MKFKAENDFDCAILRASAFHLWDRGFHSRCGQTNLCEESVNALPKVVGFLRVLRFPLTGNVDRGGLGLVPNLD